MPRMKPAIGSLVASTGGGSISDTWWIATGGGGGSGIAGALGAAGAALPLATGGFFGMHEAKSQAEPRSRCRRRIDAQHSGARVISV